MIDGHSNIHSYVSIHLSTRNKLSISYHFISFAKKIIWEIAYQCVPIFPHILAQKYTMFLSSFSTP